MPYVNAPRYLLRKQCLLKFLKDIPVGKVLEIGCGAGDFCHTLYRRGFTVKGIDYSHDAIEECRRRLVADIGDRLQFASEDLHAQNDRYDAIVICEVLEHIEDDDAAMKKIRALLKPGGHLLLSVPAHSRWFGPSDRFVGHFRRYDKEPLLRLMQDHGFAVRTLWSYGVPVANLTEIIRNAVYAKKAVADKESSTKKSGVNRKLEYPFRFFLNDVCMSPFYALQIPFLNSQWGTGWIVKAIRRQ